VQGLFHKHAHFFFKSYPDQRVFRQHLQGTLFFLQLFFESKERVVERGGNMQKSNFSGLRQHKQFLGFSLPTPEQGCSGHYSAPTNQAGTQSAAFFTGAILTSALGKRYTSVR
jgi:hypothetical protein